ncbi:diaminopimelate epimerase [Myxococcota bacterium]|nr:diaminopimelate epimerase [Myxococcota bacterium]
MRLRKYHGLGNDYLVLETSGALTAPLVRALCDRHRGPGGDGVLEPLPFRRGDDGRPASAYAVRIWNPDGSRAEKSGNGLRILARWLRDHRAAPPAFTVEVRIFEQPGEVVRCEVVGPAGTGEVTVEMGAARFEAEAVPCARPLRLAPVEVAGARLAVTAVGLGNPHCVVLLDDPELLDQVPWRAWGAALEVHPLFPNRTNVQVAAVLPRSVGEGPPGEGPPRLAARIWERGAGETQASGSSACAVAAVAASLGRVATPGPVQVEMPGGTLLVEVGADLALRLRGPVEEVGAIELAGGWLANRGG